MKPLDRETHITCTTATSAFLNMAKIGRSQFSECCWKARTIENSWRGGGYCTNINFLCGQLMLHQAPPTALLLVLMSNRWDPYTHFEELGDVLERRAIHLMP